MPKMWGYKMAFIQMQYKMLFHSGGYNQRSMLSSSCWTQWNVQQREHKEVETHQQSHSKPDAAALGRYDGFSFTSAVLGLFWRTGSWISMVTHGSRLQDNFFKGHNVGVTHSLFLFAGTVGCVFLLPFTNSLMWFHFITQHFLYYFHRKI